jgi:hypothetical protein
VPTPTVGRFDIEINKNDSKICLSTLLSVVAYIRLCGSISLQDKILIPFSLLLVMTHFESDAQRRLAGMVRCIVWMVREAVTSILLI